MLLALAADREGLDTCIVAPGGVTPATSTLALFADERGGAPVRAEMSRTVVRAGAPRDLGRGYAVLDVPGLVASLPRRVRIFDGRAVAVEGKTVTLADGCRVSARAVVDASGAVPALVALEPAVPAWQTAFGRIVEGRVEAAGLDEDTAILMDWSDAADDPADGNGVDHGGTPSFCYALPLGGGRFLIEETALCARPAVGLDVLAGRLDRRLTRFAAQGARITRFVAEERVSIPMGTGLPRRGQRVAAFGAAAGLIHPATGYSVARALALAPRVATTLAKTLGVGEDEQVGDRVRDALWPVAARRARGVFLVALEAACRFHRRDAQAFFSRFFSLPLPSWRGFLDGTLGPDELFATMRGLFGGADLRTRVALARGVLSRRSVHLLRGAISPSGGQL